MRKLPRELDDVVDNVLLDICEWVAPFFKATGHTANMLTIYSIICGLLYMKAIREGKFVHFAAYYGISYFFDCLDGYYARRYHMVSKFGEYLDHIKDNTFMALTWYILFTSFPSITKHFHIFIFLFFLFLLALHTGCQQKYYNKRHLRSSEETLDLFQGLCKDEADLRWTRYFGCGTFNVLFVYLVYDIMKSEI
jgi:phosphatidylglycerophosphate synthase